MNHAQNTFAFYKRQKLGEVSANDNQNTWLAQFNIWKMGEDESNWMG